MKKNCLIFCLSIVCLLLLAYLSGCGVTTAPTSTVKAYWHESKGTFQTNDLKRAQNELPFTIIVPTNLPNGMDPNYPFDIYGPLKSTVVDPNTVHIQYGDGEKQITIEESNTISVPFPDSNAEPTFITISGISVLREKHKGYWGSNISIPALRYRWNQANCLFSVDVWTYSETEGEAMVESMIKQLK
jgi:hypothetical protein